MKAIDTFYNGNYFRSRLEARWAYFFDLVGIKYKYEPEGFTNGTERYLPDFFLENVYASHHGESCLDDVIKIEHRGSVYSYRNGIYLEIKPESYNSLSFKFNWFDRALYLFQGEPYVVINEMEKGSDEVAFAIGCWWDLSQVLCRYSDDKFFIDFSNRAWVDDEMIAAAKQSAMKRFEHADRETPSV